MKTIRDTELKYVNGDRMLEGDIVEFEWYEFRAVPEKIKCVITYKNGAFYLDSELLVNGKPALSVTIASVLENNAQVPRKNPMIITKYPLPSIGE
jgi:hypothetical protein